MKFVILLSLFFSIHTYAHGEDAPGPHNGHIKMVGTFHIEVAADTDGSFHVFLLDVNFKNPTIKDSSIEMTLDQKGKKNPFKCEVMGRDHFHCKPLGKYTLKNGQLLVKAKRENAVGDTSYELPLKWKTGSAEAQSQDHSKHH
jgi:hypothetical protein